jgi:hypothetical protein
MNIFALSTALLCIAMFAAPASGQSDGQSAAPSSPISSSQLDSLLAPIALYPDALVVQILQCAMSPFEVKSVNEWLTKNPTLNGTAAQEAASKQGFDDSFVAIVIFPDVLKMMADKPDWTAQLGSAFTTDRNGVMATVQRLRKEAESMGNLKTTAQQSVQTVTTDGGQQVIVIQPANPQVVYVPRYNPQVVYTQPAPSTATVQNDNSGRTVAAGLIGFAAGVVVGAAADHNDDQYYYSCGGWGYRRPICYSGGYDAYYNNRQNAANNYYDHRENMANQARENQQNRQDRSSSNQQNRQDARSDASGQRSSNQAARQDTWSQGQSNRSGARSSADENAFSNWSSRQESSQSRGGMSSQWGAGGSSRFGSQSGAFSGYQRGSTERASSSRGRESLGGRSGGFNRGGGLGRGGGRRR